MRNVSTARRAIVMTIGIGIGAIATFAAPALAGDKAHSTGEEPRFEFDFDDPTPGRIHVTDNISVGASVEFEVENEVNLNLDDQDDEDVLELEPSFNLSAAYEPDGRFRAFAEFELSRKFIVVDPKDKGAKLELEVKEAYLTFFDVFDDLTITVGRQKVSDDREWLLDEELDGARTVYRNDEFSVEAGLYREELLSKDLLGEHDNDEPDLFYLRGYAAAGDDSVVSAYALGLNGRRRNRGDDLVFLGASSGGALGSGFDYWVEGAVVVGREDGRKVRGFGFDIGATKTFETVPTRPYVTFGLAFGSGDDGRGTDTAFRQTGVQDNSDRFGGVTSIKYYGEVFDPELSNLIIPTFGIGFRPTRRSSVDLIYHKYLQQRLSDDLRKTALDRDPFGNRRSLGDEIDLVIGIRESNRVSFEAIGGVFLPGAAFGGDDDPGFFFGLKVEVRF